VALGGTQLFTATISNTTNTALNWYVNGVLKGNAAQGTLTACTTVAPWKCTYTAPPLNVPSPNPAVIKVASAADPSKFKTASVTVVTAGVCESGNESVLKGQYAFSLTGYNSHGFTAVVGSITVDGAGTITEGEADTNGGLGLHNASAISAGTYSVGADNRGCATIVTGFGTLNTRFDLGAISSGKTTQGQIMEFDPATSSAFIATGQILRQTPANFSAGLSGSYVVQDVGVDAAGSRFGVVGVISASGGKVSAGEGDINDAGIVGSYTGETGTYGSADSNGRFATTTSVPDGPTTHCAVYLVSSSKFLGLTRDPASPNGILAVEGAQQTGAGAFSNRSLSGNMVFYMAGLNSGGTGGKIDFGLFGATGTGSVTVTDYADDAGTWSTPNPSTFTCAYSVARNGRMTLSGGSNCGSGAPLFYLTAANQAFMLGTNSSVKTGQLEPQTRPTGGFTTASLVGAFFGGTTEIVKQGSKAEGDILTLTGSGSPNVTIIADKSSTASQTADDVSTDTVTVASNGTFTTASTGLKVIGIAISPTAFLVANHLSSSYPTISVSGPSTADTVTVSITSPTGAQSVHVKETLGIHVSVTGTSNTSLTWTVYDVTNGNSTYGTITGTYPSFTYTAPATLPSPATFKITATSNADVSKRASLSVTITGGAGAPPLSITTTSLPNGTVGTSYDQTVKAAGGTQPYTWSVTGGSLPGWATLNSSTGAITGTPSATGTSKFTVTVTDSTLPTHQVVNQPLSLTVNLAPLTVITTSLPGAVVGTHYSEPLQASGGTPPYTWTVATGSTLPSWLTLSSSGTLSGTPTTAAASNFSLTVTDSSVPPQSKTVALTLTVVSPTACGTGNESVLKGQFAFILRGRTADGVLEAVGSFTADGKGNITAGTVDANSEKIEGNGLGVHSGRVTATGSSYSVGSDNRGCATIVTPFYTFVARFAISPNPAGAAQGRMTEFEPAPVYYVATGQIFQQQVPAAVPPGNWVHTEWGAIDTAYYASGMMVTGVDVYGSGGEITNGEYDFETYGGITKETGLTGTYTTPDPTTGRYTLTTGVTGASSTSLNRVAYLVSRTQILEITSTANTILAGDMQLQSGSLTLSGNLAIYGSGDTDVAAFGLVNATGTSYTANIYQDNAGTWATPTATPVTCSYTIDSLGRAATSGTNCGSVYTLGAWAAPPVIYLTGPNTGFLQGESGDDASQEYLWMILPRSATSITAGNYYFGMQIPWYSSSFYDGSSGVATITSGDSLTGTEDMINNLRANVPISATFAVNSDGTFSSSSNPGVIVGLVISDSQFVEVVEDESGIPRLLIFNIMAGE
jgi:hypothetical protein